MGRRGRCTFFLGSQFLDSICIFDPHLSHSTHCQPLGGVLNLYVVIIDLGPDLARARASSAGGSKWHRLGETASAAVGRDTTNRDGRDNGDGGGIGFSSINCHTSGRTAPRRNRSWRVDTRGGRGDKHISQW